MYQFSWLICKSTCFIVILPLLQATVTVALTVSVVTSVLVERVAVASVCVRDVLVQTASVDPTVNAPRKASIAV